MTHKEDWERAKEIGEYVPINYTQDGFIHASRADQVLATANRRYKADKDLVLLVIDETKVPHRIIYEDLTNRGEKHPHIYGRLPIEAVVDVYKLLPGVDGDFIDLPNEMKVWEEK